MKDGAMTRAFSASSNGRSASKCRYGLDALAGWHRESRAAAEDGSDRAARRFLSKVLGHSFEYTEKPRDQTPPRSHLSSLTEQKSVGQSATRRSLLMESVQPRPSILANKTTAPF